jgi:hypothetical protein
MPDRKSPLDQALDLLFYAPLGLALTARDELPKLVDKGRQQVSGQVALAKMIGQFAVTTGQKEAEKAASRLAAGAASRLGALPGVPASTAAAPAPPRAPAPPAHRANGWSPNGAPRATGDQLAIPGYDTLSASQVVLRLGGLSDGELDAVRAYEEATRSRRTILAKVAQLQHERA